jgi:hypothetical protein
MSKSLLNQLDDAKDIIRKYHSEILAQKRTLASFKHANDTAEKIRTQIWGISAYDPPPPAWVTGKGGNPGHRGCPVTIWSDWHWGETVFSDEVASMNEFTPEIGHKRVKKLVNTTVSLCYEHMGKPPINYPGIVICLGGDFITGDIHEELAVTNAQTTNQSIEDVTDALAGGIDNMATKFGNVFLPCVVGNHGRNGKQYRFKQRVYTSFEWNIYCNLKRHFKNTPHVKFLIPNEADAYFTVFGHRYLLTHGDGLGVKGGDGIIGAVGPIMRGALKVGRSESQIGRDIDTIIMGHWHQYLTLPGVIVNNSLIGYNEYARLKLRAPYSRPSQALWFTHPEHGITAHWQVYLEALRQVQQTKAWVEWQE